MIIILPHADQDYKNQGSHIIQLDWASIFVARIERFLHENDIPTRRSTLIKIKVCRKYNWIRLQYLLPELKIPI